MRYEGRLLAMNIQTLKTGYALQGNPPLNPGVAMALGKENERVSLKAEIIKDKAQVSADEPLTPDSARIFKIWVGKAMYISHHRPDIHHSMNTLSRSMRNRTTIAMRRLKRLTGDFLGTGEVYRELVFIHMHKSCRCQSTATALTTKKLVRAAAPKQCSFTDAQFSHGHAHRRRELLERRGRALRH